MKSIYKLIIFLFFSLPALVLADADVKTLLQPSEGDKSLVFLKSMFGQVDGVLHGGGSLVLGTMLGIVNSAFLVLASVVLVYILFISTINTAHEGEALGKKWSTIWVPIRLVTSISLLIPKATGYSMIQILVMWIVVQGVGLADNVWKGVLTYFQAGGQFILGDSGAVQGESYGADSLTGQLLRAQICMFQLEKTLNEQRPKGARSLNFASTVEIISFPLDSSGNVSSSMANTTKWKSQVIFPGSLSSYEPQYRKYENVCGAFEWIASNRTAMASKIAVNQLIFGTQTIARKIVSDNTSANIITSQMVNTASDYLSIMATVGDYKTPPIKFDYNQAVKDGWITAGSYFQRFTTNYRASQNLGDVPTPAELSNYGVCNKTQAQDANVTGAKALACEQDNIKKSIGNANSAISKFISDKKEHNAGVGMMATDQIVRGFSYLADFLVGPATFVLGPFGIAFGAVSSGIIKVLQGLIALSVSNYTIHPLIPLVTLGEGLISLANALVAASATTAFTAALAGVFPAVNPIGFGIVSIATLASSLIGAISDYLYVSGIMLAYYLPTVPAIIFTFGVLGWLVAILESIIAAPLVALGIASPGAQSELFGKAEPAMMLILNIFLRPTLMVMGFVMGILLSAIGIWIFHLVFDFGSSVAAYFAQKFELSINGLVMVVIYLFTTIGIYVVTATVIFQRSFALIHILPDNIMRWLAGGAQAQFGSEFKNAEGEAKQSAQEAAKTTSGSSRGFEQGAGRLIDTGQRYGAYKEKQAEQEKRSEGQVGGKPSQ